MVADLGRRGFGDLRIRDPDRAGAGALALVWVVGAYSIVFGAMLVGLSFRLRNHRTGSS